MYPHDIDGYENKCLSKILVKDWLILNGRCHFSNFLMTEEMANP